MFDQILDNMRLEEYLEALEDCPDEELCDELSIHDNFPIFLGIDFDTFIDYLRSSEDYDNKFESI